MKIRCPECKRHFEYDPSGGPAVCPYEDCGWRFQKKSEAAPTSPISVQADPVESGPPGNFPLPTGRGSSLVPSSAGPPAFGSRGPALPNLNYIRCPKCRSPIPDNTEYCPVCSADLSREFAKAEGVRAVFDVSGDITFTPKMVVVLFLATLTAFLTFTWILTNKGKEQSYTPLVITDTKANQGTENPSLQGVTFTQLKNEFLDPKNTDLRKDVLVQKFRGQRVIWSGLVKKVAPDEKGYQVDLVMESLDSRSFVTLNVLKLEANERLIANISRGQTVLFSGKISEFDTGGAASVFDYFRIILQDGIILK